VKNIAFISLIEHLSLKIKFLVSFVLILSIINSLVELLLVGILAGMIANLLFEGSIDETSSITEILTKFGLDTTINNLPLLGGIVFMIFMWRLFFLYYGISASREIGQALSYTIYQKTMHLKSYTKFSLPEITTIITNKVNAAVNGIIVTSFTIVSSVFSILALFMVIYFTVGKISVVILGILVFSFFIFFKILKGRADFYSRSLADSVVKSSSIMMNIFENRAVLVLTGMYNKAKANDQFRSADYAAKNAIAKLRVYQDLAKPIFDFAINISIIICAYFASSSQEYMGEDLVLLIITATRVMPYMQNAYRGFITYRGATGSTSLVVNLLNEATWAASLQNQTVLRATATDVIDLKSSDLEISIGDHNIKYPDFQMKASRGLYVVTGPSGSGKSTLLNAICGLNDFKGSLRLKYPNNGGLLPPIGLCPQNVWLFKGTIKDNLEAYIDHSIEGTALMQVKDLVLCMGLLNRDDTSLEEFLHKNIGDNGQGLSGGEIKRIGILRSLLNNPMILIIDEPTSGLDAETAGAISDLLVELAKGIVVLVITHDPNVIRRGHLLLDVGSNGAR